MALQNRVWRVKVYKLGGDGEWGDLGTGYLDIEGVEITVYNEDSPDIKILQYSVKNEEYRKQGNSILTWVDESLNSFALSFQEKTNAQEALEEICKIQSKNPSDIGNEEDEDDCKILADPNVKNLSEIIMALTCSNNEKLVKEIFDTGFLQKIQKILSDCAGDKEKRERLLSTGGAEEEDAREVLEGKQGEDKNKAVLQMIFMIYKQLFHLNSQEMLEALLSDEHFDYVLRGLEHDPGLNGIVYDLKSSFYESKMNNFLGINDEMLLGKVKKIHRLQFVKDMALCRSLEDSTCTFFNFSQYSLARDIICIYISSDALRQKLSCKLECSEPGALNFLIELCNIAKSCMPQVRHDLYDALYEDGVIMLLDTLSYVPDNEKILEFLGEIYSNILDISPFLLKNLLFSSTCSLGNSLLQHLASSLLSSKSLGTIQELGKLLRLLLEPDTNLHYDRILEFFYKDICPQFISNLNPATTQDILYEILTIFTFCVEKHSERIRLLLVLSDILSKASSLAVQSKHLSIYSLKFFKAVLQKNDKTINAVLVRNSYLDWIFNIFIENSSRQGMLFSLVLSILDTLKKADSVVLDYVIKKFLPKMKEKSLEMHFEMLIEELKKQKKPQSVMTSFSQRDIQDSDDQESLDASSEEESGLRRKSQEEYLPVKKPKILNHFRDI